MRHQKAFAFYLDYPILQTSIPTPETLHGKAQADYSLLMTQAMDKNYINFTSDSLIKFAVGYYGGHTEDLVAKGKSFYYYGRVMESLDTEGYFLISAICKALSK